MNKLPKITTSHEMKTYLGLPRVAPERCTLIVISAIKHPEFFAMIACPWP